MHTNGDGDMESTEELCDARERNVAELRAAQKFVDDGIIYSRSLSVLQSCIDSYCSLYLSAGAEIRVETVWSPGSSEVKYLGVLCNGPVLSKVRAFVRRLEVMKPCLVRTCT